MDLGRCQLGRSVFHAAIARYRAVDLLVGVVLGSRRPAKMGRVYAPFVSFAARMRGVVLRGWWGPVNRLANEAMGEVLPASNLDMAVSLAIRSVWPAQTIRADMGNGPDQECRQFAGRGPAPERIAVPAI
jgi:hypothetical protein